MEQVQKEFRSMKRLEILLTLLVVLALGAFASASAQTSKGFVTGVVEDPNGAGIANASIKITNLTTGVSRDTVADSSGSFRLDAVDPGPRPRRHGGGGARDRGLR